MLVGTDVCIQMVCVWEETGVPGGNLPVWLGDHMTISHGDEYHVHITKSMVLCSKYCDI